MQQVEEALSRGKSRSASRKPSCLSGPRTIAALEPEVPFVGVAEQKPDRSSCYRDYKCCDTDCKRALGGRHFFRKYFAAFIIALFTEMYDFPLMIYLLSGWIAQNYPGIDPFSHDAGDLSATILGLHGNPQWSFLHILSNVAVFGGFLLLATAWRTLHEAQRRHDLAATGIYAYVRHPQYVGFIVIMLGFLLRWPTPLTVLMFPVLVVMYVPLVWREEREALGAFGAEYEQYMRRVPGFLPCLSPPPEASAH